MDWMLSKLRLSRPDWIMSRLPPSIRTVSRESAPLISSARMRGQCRVQERRKAFFRMQNALPSVNRLRIQGIQSTVAAMSRAFWNAINSTAVSPRRANISGYPMRSPPLTARRSHHRPSWHDSACSVRASFRFRLPWLNARTISSCLLRIRFFLLSRVHCWNSGSRGRCSSCGTMSTTGCAAMRRCIRCCA